MAKGDKFYYKASKEIGKKRINKQLVFDLLSKSANYNNAKACYALATWYLHGEFVKRDYSKGFELLKVAAKDNIAAAYYDLAVCFETGRGVKKNYKSAFQNYLNGALFGEKQSIYEVGRCYFYGIGIRKDLEIAKQWISAAKFWKIT